MTSSKPQLIQSPNGNIVHAKIVPGYADLVSITINLDWIVYWLVFPERPEDPVAWIIQDPRDASERCFTLEHVYLEPSPDLDWFRSEISNVIKQLGFTMVQANNESCQQVFYDSFLDGFLVL